ncbi:hypothetical protein M3Y97_00089800 [Aphelenchoides bicaudatus]|nr:hypothetical protein M3Y97_00089800 [Aphelenchoides bicaudatus]
MAQQPAGILSTGQKNPSARVTLNAPDGKERKATDKVDPAPLPSNVSAPVVNAQVKDEVELLRQGVMNKHGQHVKGQGTSNN